MCIYTGFNAPDRPFRCFDSFYNSVQINKTSDVIAKVHCWEEEHDNEKAGSQQKGGTANGKK